MILLIVSTLWLGTIGFLDDMLKLKYKNKDGLKGRYKIVGQVGLGLIVGLTMYLSPDIVIRENHEVENVVNHETVITYEAENVKSTQTTIPFVKDNNFDYATLTSWLGDYAQLGGWILFIIVTILVITATSNGANLTDGLDGLAAGTSAIIGVALAIMAYLGSNVVYSSYLNIMYIPGSGELAVFGAAFVGALIGFLWYNCYPAQVFMGDTGSLAIGGIVAVFALAIRKELLLPILCGVYLMEVVSVMIQTFYFKYTKRKFGEGRRVFRMAPLHHHYQKSDIPENRIVVRFWIIQILLAAFALVTLKIR
jgi:phospho-N-acetylmuramoyl-pentapeptide-transferase